MPFLFAPAAWAFDYEAHDAIGQTTASAMDQAAIKQVKRLLGGQDVSDVAGWGNQVSDTFPGMERLHFQKRGEPFCEDAATAACEDNICLVAATKHFFAKILRDEGRKTEIPTGNVDIDYKKVNADLKFTDADAVKMLINLLGDIHQPMHLGFDADDMGRKVKVKFRGEEMSLYDFWDKKIGEVVRNDEASFWLGGWTHVGRIKGEFEEDKAKYKKDGAFAMIDAWAAETMKFACNVAYKHPGTGKMLAGPNAAEGPVEIDEAAYQEWKTAWLRQILLAGERTAIVLNDILDAASASKLTDGTKIHTKADEAAEKEKEEWEKERKANPVKNIAPSHVSTSGSSFSNFMTNLFIAIFVVPGFLVAVQYGLTPSAITALLQGILNAADAKPEAASGSGPRYAPAKRGD